jgi:signal transduction histidine kinase
VRARLSRLWRLRSNPLQVDRALAVVLTIAGELQVGLGGIAGSERIVPALLVVALGTALAIRRPYPTLAGVGAGILVALEITFRGDPQVLTNSVAYLCALYALAVWSPPRRFALGLAAVVAADLLPGAAYGQRPVWALGTTVVMLIVRRVVRDRDQRALTAERERTRAAHQAVLDERTRIARELHDVIAHSVTVMVVQAQAGPRLLGDATQARGAFESIESTGREALAELRRLLGVLRTADEQPAIGPQPGLGSLRALVEQLGEAGQRVRLRVEGTPVSIPPGVDLSAYRIVQEALTNALKHAGDAEAEVTVRYGSSMLELEVVDNGSGAAAPGSTPGHGLIGMRERVALYGGLLEAGTRNGHGYAVRARLPLHPDAAR